MAPSYQDETERKFDVDSRTIFPNLATAEGVASVDQPAELGLDAVYFDTSRYDLARHRVTLRRRTGGTDEGWHLKLPACQDTRTEVREPLGAADSQVPAQLTARVRAITRGRPLAPVAALSTARREYALRDDEGRILARVCDDVVRARRLADGEHEQAWREWEVELEAGPPSVLDAVGEVLLAAGAAVATVQSKLRRALGDLPTERSADSSEDDLASGTVGHLLTAHLTEQVARLHEQDAGLRDGRPESTHRLRIAARRLRSALSTFRPILDRSLTDPVQDELRWLGQALAPARDAQVLREHLGGLTAAEPTELVIGSAANRIDDRLSREHQEGSEQARATLDSDRYLRLLDSLEGLLDTPPLRPNAGKSARKTMRRLLARDLKRLRDAVSAIEAAEDGHDRDAAFHEARKKAKRLRYAAEVATTPLGKRARSLAKSTKHLQQVLGTHQDSVNARGRLRELGVQSHLAGDNSFTFGRLHTLEQVRAERAEAEFEELWATFSRKHAPRWER